MQDTRKGSRKTLPFWCCSWRPKKYSRILYMRIKPWLLNPPLGNSVILYFSLCPTHPQHKEVMKVWSAGVFFLHQWTHSGIKKLINHSSQKDIVQLIFKSQPESICLILKMWTDSKSSRLKLVLFLINLQEQDRVQIPSPDLRWMVRLEQHRPERKKNVVPTCRDKQAATFHRETAHKTTCPILLLAYMHIW